MTTESQCFDFICLYWRDLEFLRNHQGLLKYLHLSSLSIYRETEKDQSVNVRSEQMKRSSTKQGLCRATLANLSLKIRIELATLICWARCYHSGHKYSRHPLNNRYLSHIVSKHITLTPTHSRCLRGPNTRNLVAVEPLQAVLTVGPVQIGRIWLTGWTSSANLTAWM